MRACMGVCVVCVCEGVCVCVHGCVSMGSVCCMCTNL